MPYSSILLNNQYF